MTAAAAITNHDRQMSKHLADRFAGISTSTISNAMDELGFNGVILGLDPLIRPVSFTGLAFTVKARTKELAGSFPPTDFSIGDVLDSTQPGDAIVIAAEGGQVALLGGLAALFASTRGVAGIVIDGGVRDVDEVLNTRLPVFSRHIVPLSPRTRVRIEQMNTEVHIGNVGIGPCDIIIADSSGIVSIPRQSAERVLSLCMAARANDGRAETMIKEGASFNTVHLAIQGKLR